MYDYLSGNVEEIKPHYVVIDVNGMGYKIRIPVSHSARIKQDKKQKIYTALIIREPDISLYGFLTLQERELFLNLLTVSGVGPKLALALIGHLSIEDLHDLAIREDITKLKLVPGVGKRTAERLLVELKNKFAKGLPEELKGITLDKEKMSDQSSEAIDALMSLGYQAKDAHKAIKNILKSSEEKKISTSALVTQALQNGLK
jgi:holliday junction DNA helicase RuvA